MVSRTVTVGPLEEIPEIVRPTVEAELLTALKPVAFDKSTVAAVVVLVRLTVSTLFNAAGVTEPVITAYKMSLPAPPSKLSPELKVCRLEVEIPASNVSSPAVPVKLFVPVVSGLVTGCDKSLIQ